MPHSRFLDTNGFLITTLQGVITMKEITELVTETRDYIKDEEIFELVLHTDDVEIALDRNESEKSAAVLKSALKTIRRGAMAFVSTSDFVFGICRQLQLRVESELLQMCVFRAEETARAWLSEMRSSGES